MFGFETFYLLIVELHSKEITNCNILPVIDTQVSELLFL